MIKSGVYLTSPTRAQGCFAGVFAIVPGCHTPGGHNEGDTIALVSKIDDGKMAPEALVKTAVSGAFSLLLHMSLLTHRRPVVDVNRRSTLCEENLSDVMDLSGHGTRGLMRTSTRSFTT